MTDESNCLCGSALPYGACCGPCHRGERPATTAQALMRSRFTAFALNDEAYLLETWDPSKRPRKIDFARDAVSWSRLEIVSTKKGGPKDAKGIVEFKAYYLQDGVEYALSEISRFRKSQGRWYYLDGAVKSIAPVEQGSEGGRNAPCPCGSGKKYKRCCGKA